MKGSVKNGTFQHMTVELETLQKTRNPTQG